MPGIVSTKELARTFEDEIRTGGVARRRWVCNLSDDTLTAATPGPPAFATILAETTGSAWGAAHPEHSAFALRKVIVNERFEDDPYKVEVIGEYGFVLAEDVKAPAERAAVWSFESQPGEVAALAYYASATNGLPDAPLTNSAYDYFPGLTRDESMVRIKIQKNFTSYPSAWLLLQNHVNSSTFLGCPIDTVKVAGIEATYTVEVIGNTGYAYYATTANLLYRQSSHNLLLPDVGFNYIDSATNQKRRAMVFDFENNEWVASPNPVGLSNGAQTFGQPAILTRRVNPRANFATFGSPP